MAKPLLVNFSPNGDYFAQSSPDGSLKIWETSTGNFKQEYTHSSHLSATCTCLSWAPNRGKNDGSKKKKKRKSFAGDELANLELVALGTTSGTLLLYSVVKGDLHTQLEDGHNKTVNSICWSSRGDVLYSCSDDQYIIQWDVAKSKVKQKWKGDKNSIFALALCASENHLISASRSIKVWDIEKQEVLKTFTGHATEVFSLMSLSPPSLANGDHSGDAGVNGTYLISAALNDRLINAWHVNIASKEKTALGTFALPEEPVYLQVTKPKAEGQPILLLAITKSGQLLIFEHTLNGPMKRPMAPKHTVQVTTSGGKQDTPRPVSVLGGLIQDDSQLLLAHGSFLKPRFEHLEVQSLEPDTCLIREDPTKTLMEVQTAVSKVKTPSVSADVTVLGPGHMAPAAPVRDEAGVRKKRRKSGELSMEERLHAISIDKPSSSNNRRHPPKADALATLLTQGLQSQDKNILNNVFQNSNEMVLRNTVKRLPVPVIVPLVQELSRRMHGHAQSGHNLIKWVRVVLTVHTSYLMTFPELVETLSSLYQMMDSRTAMFTRLSRLQGKLDLMLSQVTAQGQEEEASSSQPLLVYNDESSDSETEDMGLGAIAASVSDSEDNWEELSDMEADNSSSSEDEEDPGAGRRVLRKRGRGDSESNGVEQQQEEDMSDSDGGD